MPPSRALFDEFRVTIMFGWLASKPFVDPELGPVRRSGGHWKGSVVVEPCGTFRLTLPGGRHGPDPLALWLAKELSTRFLSLRSHVQNGLHDHYIPYKEAVEGGESPDPSCPDIERAEGVWAHVKPAHVLIEPLRDTYLVEVAFRTAWDVEHTVAAIFRDWQFVEFNGSVRGQ
jgi:hypothetical protein